MGATCVQEEETMLIVVGANEEGGVTFNGSGK
jgi:hypothetical protein